jgi:hypothetical protein
MLLRVSRVARANSIPVKSYHCTHCGNLVLFDSASCVRCSHRLAYEFDGDEMVAVAQDPTGGWQRVRNGHPAATVRLCRNNLAYGVCSGIARPGASAGLCPSCELTRTIPNLTRSANRGAWVRMEHAKSRLLYTLRRLGLTWRTREEDPEHGLAFDFLSDEDADEDEPIITGHDEGVITLSLQEADDAVRENRRQHNREEYRTVLGHFRHEIGHYYWDVLIRDAGRVEPFRALFGDERRDYQEALDVHYAAGPPPHWSEHFISGYASSHPWEDWAESFAHYLHMVDVLEIADDAGLDVEPVDREAPHYRAQRLQEVAPQACDHLLARWSALTFVLNNLNRGMGLRDLYPFVLNAAAVAKLRFVHDEVSRVSSQRGVELDAQPAPRAEQAQSLAAD